MLQLVSCTCPVLHALFFSLELELLEGRVRAYSRGPTELAQQSYTCGLSLCSPFLSGQGHPHVLGFLCGLRFPFLLLFFSLLLPLLLPLNFSFSSSSFFLPPSSLPSGPLLLPSSSCRALCSSHRPGSCSSPGGLQRAAPCPLGRSTARALPVRSGGRKRTGSRGEWTPPSRGAAPAGGCLGLGSGAGARILPLLLGPGFGAGLGGAASAP